MSQLGLPGVAGSAGVGASPAEWEWEIVERREVRRKRGRPPVTEFCVHFEGIPEVQDAWIREGILR